MLKYLHDGPTFATNHSRNTLTTTPIWKVPERGPLVEPAPIMASELGADWKNMTWTHFMMRMFNRIHFTQVEAHLLMVQLPGWKKHKRVSCGITYGIFRGKTPISRLACGSAGVARLYLSVLKRDSVGVQHANGRANCRRRHGAGCGD